MGDLIDPDVIRSPARLDTSDSGGALGTLDEIEQQAILRTIRHCGGDKDKAAAILKISRAKIYQRLKLWRELEEAGSE